MTRLMMTVIVIIVVVGAVMATTGILRFYNTTDETGVTIDKKELKEQTREAVERAGKTGGAVLDKTGETLHEAAEQMRGSSDNRKLPPTTPATGETGVRQPNGSKNSPENREHQLRH
jgi:hypothetical protein